MTYRYTKECKTNTGVVWRFEPPKDALDAGVVTRQSFRDGRTARFEIPKLIERVEAFRRGEIVAGNIGPTSTGMHTDIKASDGSRFDLSELDEFVYVQDRDYGRISLTGLRQATGYVGDDFDQHKARGSHGIDVGTHTGDGLYLINGAVFLENESYESEHGYVAVIQLPNGKKFEFRHGTKAQDKPGQLI